MKKLVSMLLAVLMVVGMFPVSALAEENPTITLTSGVSEAKIGDTIEVTAAVANNPGFSSMALSLQYDEEVLEFKGIKKEQNLYGQEVTSGLFGAGTCEYNGNKIAFAGTSDIAVNNTLFIAVFEVIGSGETDVSVSVEEFKNASGTSFAETAVVVSSPSVNVEPEVVEATGITIDKEKLNLGIGETDILKATVLPEDATDKTVVWSSSDESVATVENGVVTAVKAGTATITAKTGEFEATCEVTVIAEQAYPVTVIAPAGSVVSIGTMRSYYIYSFEEPIAVIENGETVTYGFNVPTSSGNAFVRVQNPEGVTYWDYTENKIEEGTVITITKDDLFMNDDKHNPDTVIDDLSEYEIDVADVYINANEKGYMDLDIGETFEFNVFRDWQAVEGIQNSKTALPDVHYEVIDFEGKASDVVSVVPDKNNSSVAEMTANKEGTAIVLVTYDAMYSTLALRGSIGTDTAYPAFFSAIWPENTGVLVVSVGNDGSSVITNMILNGHALDAEHDVLYYVGDEGASYTFKPENDCKIEVARPVIRNNKLTFSGFDNTGVEVAANGKVTVSGLMEGANIIKIEDNGKVTYQVISVKQTTSVITHEDGTEVTAENPANPGETLTVQLGDIYNPVNKLSGIYNSNCSITYNGEDGKVYSGKSGSVFGYYLFANDKEVHKVDITVPENWADDIYTLNGYFGLGGFGGGLGLHRSLTYKGGKDMDTNASATSALIGRLPELAIPVNAAERIPAEKITLDKENVTIGIGGVYALSAKVEPENTNDRVEWSSSDEKVASVDKNGIVTGISEGKAVITVKAGDVFAECEVTVGEAKGEDIVIRTDFYEEFYTPTIEVSEIIISGAEPLGEPTSDKYHVNWEVSVAKCESVTVTVSAAPSPAVQRTGQGLNFYLNDIISNPLSTYENYTCTVTVPLEWDGDRAVINLGICQKGDINKIKSQEYSVTLIMHEHNFVKEVAEEKYLVSEADCENAAVYYKSCECGEAGTETFKYGKSLGHKDENKDHVCDNNCGIAQGEHADTNKDHACDYGCSVAIGTCEDANKDHACDYGCGKAYGEHKDSADDKDHVCDYCNSDEVLEECSGGVANCTEKATCSVCGEKYGEIDSDAHDWNETAYSWAENGTNCTASRVCKNNETHVEYAPATVTFAEKTPANCTEMGWTTYTATFAEDWAKTQTKDVQDIPALEHKDENRDHVCDNSCGIVQGEHVDSDKDHVCDYGCSVAIGTCEDTDKDHVCDYGCGKAYGTCEDTNKDHACDYGCGKAYGEHKDSADDKDHVCDYGCRAVLEECSGGVANCTEKATCSVCGEKYGDIDSDAHAWTVSYNWSEDGKACTATKACANNAEHNLTAEATVTSVVAKEANCSVMGDTQYTATFAADWAETQVTVRTDIAIDEDAHEWGEWEVVKEASYTEEGSKKRVCENDESHVETETIAKLVPTATEKTEGPDDTKEYVVAYQEGVVMVPAGLENEYPNQQAVKDALKAKVENGDLEDEVNLVFREVTVGYYENGVFVPVSNREFFENGKTIDILLKYPEGADKNDKFEVYHLRDDGVIEKCEIKGKTDEGIVIEVGSLSPFVIAYSKNIEEEDKFTWEDLFNWFEDHTKPSKPSNKPNPGITIITPEDEKEEANPNTGAPVIGIAPFAVLAVAAFAAGRKMKK